MRDGGSNVIVPEVLEDQRKWTLKSTVNVVVFNTDIVSLMSQSSYSSSSSSDLVYQSFLIYIIGIYASTLINLMITGCPQWHSQDSKIGRGVWHFVYVYVNVTTVNYSTGLLAANN